MEFSGLSEGFVELSHTADWALRVWAQDISGLYQQAALGMYSLMGLMVRPSTGIFREISMEASDDECLLVNFLSELLYLAEEERVGFTALKINVKNQQLTASGEIGQIEDLQKEIKAVTFHNLAIKKNARQYEVTIVFDV